jgi:4'-phosphopantetheinyl transferase
MSHSESWNSERVLRLNDLAKLAIGEIQIWRASVDGLIRGLGEAQIHSVLSAAEVEKASNYSNIDLRNEYMATRYLVRNLLSYYSPEISPKGWRFDYNKYGKPGVECKVGPHRLEFNLSHSTGIILCAFCLNSPVGIDIEFRGRRVSWTEMARESFSPQEAGELGKHVPGSIPRRFFEYWTLKEAFIKAMGMGLSLPLAEFTFRIANGLPIGIEFTREIAEDPAQWQFRLFENVKGYQSALAVRCGAHQKVSIVQMGEYSLLLPSQKAA